MAADGDAGRHEGIDAMVRAALARHAAGDPTAKNDLLAHAQTQFQRMARKLLRGDPDYQSIGRWEQTDDVVQGLMMRMSEAIDHLQRFESPRHFFKLAAKHIHWELRALRERHLAEKRNIDKYRSDIEQRPGGGPPIVGGMLAETPARDDRLAELSRYLKEIDTVPAEDLEILGLVLVNSLTREEAACHLEMSLSTFNRRYRESLLRLRGHVVGDDGQKHG